MSYRSAAWAWEQNQLKPMVRLTLLALANRCDGDDCCYPRIKVLAQDANVSTRTVSEALRELAERGLVAIEHQYRDDGSLRSSLYRLCIRGGEEDGEYGAGGSAGGAVPPHAGGAVPHAPGAEQEPSHRTQSYIEPDTHTREVDDAFMQRMGTEYAEALGGEEVVRETIQLALSHSAAKKYSNPRLYVQNWLRRDAQRAAATKEQTHGTAHPRGSDRRSSPGSTGRPAGQPGSGAADPFADYR